MQLTRYTDYSLRVLVYLSLKTDSTVTITEIADYYGISRNHLVKVVHNLANLGYIQTTRGKGGGLRLGHPAEEIKIGTVVRDMEPNFDIVECFSRNNMPCIIEPLCALKHQLKQASDSFLAVLDEYSLADAVNKDKNIPIPTPIQRLTR
jgi:Rrf2 family nitric oxide-sensitive transcriptional repressor